MVSDEAALRWRCPACGDPLALGGARLRCAGCGSVAERRAGVWSFGEALEPEGFSPARRAHLAALEAEHFWFPPRLRLLLALLERSIPPGGAAIELGCGSGAFLERLAGRHAPLVGVEAYAESLAAAARRAGGAVLIAADATQVPLAAGQFDLAVALDVLEHLEPAPFLSEAHRLVKRGGRLLLSVPAFPSLWSPLDEVAGHRCRYRRRVLERELAANGWELVHATHYQALLFPLVWLSRRLPDRDVPLERRPPRWLGRALGAVNALEVRLWSGRRLRFGSSLCAVARRCR